MIEPLQRLGLTAPRVLDLGGHMGQFAIMARTVFPDCHVTSVEASESVLDDLESFAHEVHNAVLWDRDNQEVAFWHRHDDAPGGSTGNSCFRENTQYFSDLEVQAGRVWCETRTTTTLDTLLAGDLPYDLVKLDLQGAELRTLLGGQETIRSANAILCEQQRVEYNCGAPMADEVDAAIRRAGLHPSDKTSPDTFRLAWESDHDVVGQMQLDRLYVRKGSKVEEEFFREPERGEVKMEAEA